MEVGLGSSGTVDAKRKRLWQHIARPVERKRLPGRSDQNVEHEWYVVDRKRHVKSYI